MKRVYLYLKDGSYTCYADIPDDVSLPPLSTTEPVPQGLKRPVWQDGHWQEGSQEGSKDDRLSYTDILKPLPTSTQKLVMQQSQQIVLLQSATMQQNQDNAKLQAANQQQNKQIKQLQQMFMLANQQQAVSSKKGDN